MIRDRGDGGGKVEIQLAVLGVAGDLCLGIIEQVLREVVDGILRNVVTGQNDRADRNRGHIAVGAVNIGGDDVLGVVVRRCAEAFDVLVVKGNEVDVLGGGEVSDGGRGSAGDDEGRVDLAVLDVVGAVAEGLVGRDDVIFGQAISTEDVDGVEVHAGTGRADGDALARKVSNGLDGSVGRDDLHLLHVERGDSGEAVDLAGLLKEVRSVVGVGHNVGLAERELGVAVLKLHDVCLRAVADKADDVHTRVIGRVLGDDGAEGIVGAGFAAGDKAELRAGRGSGRRGGAGIGGCCGFGLFSAGGERQQHDSCEQKSDKLFHLESSYVCAERTDFFSQVLLYRMRRRFARGVP